MITDKKLHKYVIISGIIAIFVVSTWSFIIVEEAFALPHSVGVVGDFNGKFDEKMINTEGKFRISGEIKQFILTGTFDNEYHKHVNPTTGKYVTSNPNCQRLHAGLVLQSVESKINLDFNGKNCKIGLISYVIGTFEVIDSEGKYEIKQGEGRITFVADHHNNNVHGQLKGVFS